MNKRTQEQKRKLIAEWERSGETAKAYCERRGLSRSTLHRWNRESAKGDRAGIPFVPVIVSDVRKAQRQGPCRIHVGNQFIVECGEDTNPRAVELALRGAVAACSPILTR
jgi:hypothetical protein